MFTRQSEFKLKFFMMSGFIVAYSVSKGLCFSLSAGASADTLPPNIILILTDDQGWSMTSGLMDPLVPESKSTYLEMPNIDRLAAEGVRFTSGYAPSALCTPTRRSILSGTSAARTGPDFPSNTSWIPKDHLTIPTALQKANPNYRSAHFGKWGGIHMASTPEEAGYAASSGVTDNPEGGMPATLGFPNHEKAPPHFIDNEDPKRSFSISDDSVAFIREQVEAGRPFYVQASYYAPHLSIVCKESTLKKYEAKGEPDRGYTPAFAAMLEDMDAGIGRILDALDELGIADNTYVFFLSDNGGRKDFPGGDVNRLPPNHPLDGFKSLVYEGGVRVPFIVRGPGVPAGEVSRVPVIGYDLLPTFYDLAGGREPMPDHVDGGSIRQAMLDPANGKVQRPMEGIFFHRPPAVPYRRFGSDLLYSSAVRVDDLKLILSWSSLGWPRAYKLYDLSSDPRELGRDITGAHPERAGELRELLMSHLTAVGAPLLAPQEDASPLPGAQVIYLNNFTGAADSDPSQAAEVNPELDARVSHVALNGGGQMVSQAPIAGSGMVVKLAETPLDSPTVRLTVELQAISRGSWMGIGFQGKSGTGMNDLETNSGPWLQIKQSSISIHGGAGANEGATHLFRETHCPGDRLKVEMIYDQVDGSVNLLVNGYVAARNLPIVHEYPAGMPSKPSILYLQMQIWNEAGDTAHFDGVKVETLSH